MEERLGAVRLLKVKDRPAGTYSGGFCIFLFFFSSSVIFYLPNSLQCRMKRRLSVAICTIGNPKIIFMVHFFFFFF